MLCPYDEVADMTGQTDDALVLMDRALASRDPLELALAVDIPPNMLEGEQDVGGGV